MAVDLDTALKCLCRRYARLSHGMEYDDLLQEARIAAWQAEQGYRADGGSSLNSHCYHRAEYALRKWMRDKAMLIRCPSRLWAAGKAVNRVVASLEELCGTEGAGDGIAEAEHRLCREWLLSDLSASTAEVVRLTLGGYTAPEIAEALGMSRDAVRQRRYFACKGMRRKLEADQGRDAARNAPMP